MNEIRIGDTEETPSEKPHPDAVVFVTNVSSGIIGGVVQYLKPLENDLSKQNIKVVSLRFPRALNLLESRGLPRALRIPAHVGFALYGTILALRLRKKYGSIIVHSHGASYALLAGFLSKVLGHHSVHTFHSPIAKQSLTVRLLAPKLDALVFVSEHLARLYRSVSNVHGKVIELIPGGVDVHGFTPASREDKDRWRREFLKRYALPDVGLLVLFVGRIVPEKGVLELVEAAGYLRGWRCPATILVVGPVLDSPSAKLYEEEIRSAMSKLGLHEWLALTGPVSHPEKERMMAAADIFVCSSHWEASGLSVVEAFASGVPVVASRAGGLEERVVDGRNGLLVEPGNSMSLAQAIRKLADSESLRRTMGERAREDALSLYSEEMLVEKHLRLYGQMLSAKGNS